VNELLVGLKLALASDSVVKVVLGCFDCVLGCLTSLMEYTNEAAFTGVAISAQPYSSACRDVVLLLRDASITVTLWGILKPLIVITSATLAGIVGYLTYQFILMKPDVALWTRIPGPVLAWLQGFCKEVQSIEDPAVAAALAAVLTFTSGNFFLGLIQRASDALLFCFLKDMEDGTASSDHAPQSLKDFINTYCSKAKKG